MIPACGVFPRARAPGILPLVRLQSFESLAPGFDRFYNAIKFSYQKPVVFGELLICWRFLHFAT
jgi:hypothetical protein